MLCTGPRPERPRRHELPPEAGFAGREATATLAVRGRREKVGENCHRRVGCSPGGLLAPETRAYATRPEAESGDGRARRDPGAPPRRGGAGAPGTPDRRRVAARAAEQRGVRPLHEGAPRHRLRRLAVGRRRRAGPRRVELDDRPRARERDALPRGRGGRAGRQALRRAERATAGSRGTPTGAPSRARARRSRGRRRPRTGSSSTRSAS